MIIHLDYDNPIVSSSWEINQSFNNCEAVLSLRSRLEHVEKIAKQECGDSEFVTLSALRAQLKTPAWQPLEDESSPIAKFLLSSAFKAPGLAGDQVSCSALALFALLNCQGKVADKAEHLYNELQDGGLEEHQSISAGDKDLIPIFEKLLGLACWELFKCQDQVESVYEDGEIQSMKETSEVLRED